MRATRALKNAPIGKVRSSAIHGAEYVEKGFEIGSKSAQDELSFFKEIIMKTIVDRSSRGPWNKVKLVGWKAPFKPREVVSEFGI